MSQQTSGSGRSAPIRRLGRLGRSWACIVGAVGVLGLVGGFVADRELLRLPRELELARQEIDRKAWVSAAPRLKSLDRWRPVWGGDEVDYLLGLLEWQTGRHQASFEAFRRVPEGSRFETPAASFLAEYLVMQWQFRAAEERLLKASRPGRKDQGTVRAMLVRLGMMDSRKWL